MSIDYKKKLFTAIVGASAAELVLAAAQDQLEEVLVTARRTPPGGTTGTLADQFALFAPGRTVQLQLTYSH